METAGYHQGWALYQCWKLEMLARLRTQSFCLPHVATGTKMDFHTCRGD